LEKELSVKEKMVFDLLKENPEASEESMAEKLGISRNTVRKRKEKIKKIAERLKIR